MRILFIGDVFGEPGRERLTTSLDSVCSKYQPDFVVANGENAAGGKGITFAAADEMYQAGVDAITMGNHTWSRKEILKIIDNNPKLIRPANFPKGVPGKGRTVIEKTGLKLGIINLLGRVSMDALVDDPFQVADREISALKSQCETILVDFHAEATSEKMAMGMYLDGRVTAVVGTHTHVQTADERVLKGGTAFISDVGMTGPSEGVIGVDSEAAIIRFTTFMPSKFEPAPGKTQFNAVLITTKNNGSSESIERIMLV